MFNQDEEIELEQALATLRPEQAEKVRAKIKTNEKAEQEAEKLAKMTAEDKNALALADLGNMSQEFRNIAAKIGINEAQRLRKRGLQLKAKQEQQLRDKQNQALTTALYTEIGEKDAYAESLRNEPVKAAIEKYGLDLTESDLRDVAMQEGLRYDNKLFRDWSKACKENMGFKFLSPAHRKFKSV